MNSIRYTSSIRGSIITPANLGCYCFSRYAMFATHKMCTTNYLLYISLFLNPYHALSYIHLDEATTPIYTV